MCQSTEADAGAAPARPPPARAMTTRLAAAIAVSSKDFILFPSDWEQPRNVVEDQTKVPWRLSIGNHSPGRGNYRLTNATRERICQCSILGGWLLRGIACRPAAPRRLVRPPLPRLRPTSGTTCLS